MALFMTAWWLQIIITMWVLAPFELPWWGLAVPLVIHLGQSLLERLLAQPLKRLAKKSVRQAHLAHQSSQLLASIGLASAVLIWATGTEAWILSTWWWFLALALLLGQLRWSKWDWSGPVLPMALVVIAPVAPDLCLTCLAGYAILPIATRLPENDAFRRWGTFIAIGIVLVVLGLIGRQEFFDVTTPTSVAAGWFALFFLSQCVLEIGPRWAVANRMHRQEALVSCLFFLAIPGFVWLTGPWQSWQPWVWTGIVAVVVSGLTGNRVLHLLQATPRSANDPLLIGAGAAAWTAIIWLGSWLWIASFLIACSLTTSGKTINYSTKKMMGRAQLKTLVGVANTIARSVRIKTIIHNRHTLLGIGSRLVLELPIIAWSLWHFPPLFTGLSFCMIAGIVLASESQKLQGEWMAPIQIITLMLFMLYHNIEPLIAINWAVLGIASTWPLVRYPRLGPDWGIALALLVVAWWWVALPKPPGAYGTTPIFLQVGLVIFGMASFLPGPLRIGMPILTALAALWIGSNHINNLPLIEVFREEQPAWQQWLQIFGWAALLWPLISQDPLAPGYISRLRRICIYAALAHAWIVLFQVLPAWTGVLWLPLNLVLFRVPLGVGTRHSVAAALWFLVFALWALAPLANLGESDRSPKDLAYWWVSTQHGWVGLCLSAATLWGLQAIQHRHVLKLVGR
jgi:hypothetical protein